MSENIWNLNTVCRCCHVVDCFNCFSLEEAYQYRGGVEVYNNMLRETFNVTIWKPQSKLSFSICEECIAKLRQAVVFKQQVLQCEQKLMEYLKNEPTLAEGLVKLEVEESEDRHLGDETQPLESFEISVKDEKTLSCAEFLDNYSLGFDNDADNDNSDHDRGSMIKKEGTVLRSSIVKTEKPLKARVRKLPSTKKYLHKEKLKPKPVAVPGKRRVRKCGNCEATFDSTSKLEVHVAKSHLGPFKCQDCSAEYDTFKAISLHIQTHGKTKVKCRQCERDFVNKSAMSGHERAVHLRVCAGICDICKKQFTYKSSLTKHILWHNGLNKRYHCHLCSHSANDSANLRIHVETVHEKQRNFVCNLCQKTFTRKKHLNAHILCAHEGIAPFSCARCGSRFSTHRQRAAHRCDPAPPAGSPAAGPQPPAPRPPPARVYRCVSDGCHATFESRGAFRTHVLRHGKDGTLPLICHICARGFSCKYSLNRHLDSHKGLKPFKCDICLKSFTQKTQVNRHKNNVHGDKRKEEKTKCDLCKLPIRDMEKHMKMHAIRPFSCATCNKTYAQKNALNRHIKESHLSISKYVCEQCGTKFQRVSRLQKHKLNCKIDKNGI